MNFDPLIHPSTRKNQLFEVNSFDPLPPLHVDIISVWFRISMTSIVLYFSLIFSKFWKGFRTLYHVADRDLRENNDEIFSVNHSDMCQKVVQYLDPRGASDHFIQGRCSAGEADSNPIISEVVESINP